MIKSFRHKGIRRFFETCSTAGIQAQHAARLKVQLAALNRAIKPSDMNAPGWKLHLLKGKNPKNQEMSGHWSISVNGNWRLTFKFDGLTVTDAASRLRITRTALSRILNGSAGISVDMALRLEAALGASAQMWLGMQTDYDLWQAEQHDRLQIEPFYAAVHA